jgi:hypothetical protein
MQKILIIFGGVLSILLACCTTAEDSRERVSTVIVKYYGPGMQGANEATNLSENFSAVIQEILSDDAREWKGTGGLTVAPRGIFIVGERQYSYYGSFIVSGNSQWQSDALTRFWEHLNKNGELSVASYKP